MAVIPAAMQQRLTPDDDAALWVEVLRVIAEDAAIFEAQPASAILFVEVGVCSHWLRPHQSRWTAAGGFAAPVGYGSGAFRRGKPICDWSVTLPLAGGVEGRDAVPRKRDRVIHVAIPARTARHKQAAVPAVWPPGTLDAKHECKVFYGFRKLAGGWKLVARSRHGEDDDRRTQSIPVWSAR